MTDKWEKWSRIQHVFVLATVVLVTLSIFTCNRWAILAGFLCFVMSVVAAYFKFQADHAWLDDVEHYSDREGEEIRDNRS